jgi:hypothetical protein
MWQVSGRLEPEEFLSEWRIQKTMIALQNNRRSDSIAGSLTKEHRNFQRGNLTEKVQVPHRR